MTGSMPGKAASTNDTWLLGSAPNSVEAPENSLALDVTWAWTSMPMTTSHLPVLPSISDTAALVLLVHQENYRPPFGRHTYIELAQGFKPPPRILEILVAEFGIGAVAV